MPSLPPALPPPLSTQTIKDKVPEIGYADLYQLASVVAVEFCGGPSIPFRLGRKDAVEKEVRREGGREGGREGWALGRTVKWKRTSWFGERTRTGMGLG
jgi:catalase (peroxidase I)